MCKRRIGRFAVTADAANVQQFRSVWLKFQTHEYTNSECVCMKVGGGGGVSVGLYARNAIVLNTGI